MEFYVYFVIVLRLTTCNIDSPHCKVMNKEIKISKIYSLLRPSDVKYTVECKNIYLKNNSKWPACKNIS